VAENCDSLGQVEFRQVRHVCVDALLASWIQGAGAVKFLFRRDPSNNPASACYAQPPRW
jgi:hypothetical protein